MSVSTGCMQGFATNAILPKPLKDNNGLVIARSLLTLCVGPTRAASAARPYRITSSAEHLTLMDNISNQD